jgi:branched-chain amino acid transport system substrate-binding protein
MSQKNDTVTLILAFLITVGLAGGGFWWFIRKSGGNLGNLGISPQNPSDTNAKVPLQERISVGERILVASEVTPENSGFNQTKQSGVNALQSREYQRAAKEFQAALQQNRNAPETMIYLNNTHVGQQSSYTIAVVVPIGSDRNGALEILRGVAQAQTAINNSGGIQGKPLKVMIANDDNDPEIAKQVATALVKKSEVLGVIGHYSSDVTLAAGNIYNTAELVMISPISTSVKLSGFGRFVFRTVPSDYVAARALANYSLSRLPQNRVAVFFNSQSAYSQSLKSEFITAISLGGGQVVGEFDLSAPDFSAYKTVEQALKQGVTVIMLAANTGTLDEALQVIQVNQQRVLLLGGDDVYTPKTLEVGGKAAVDMIVAVPWHIDGNPASLFPRQSRQLWGGDVNWRTAIAYDAAQALIQAIAQGSTRQAVQQALTSPSFSVAGASGTVRFLPSGDRNAGIQLVKVAPGKRSGAGYDFVPVTSRPSD